MSNMFFSRFLIDYSSVIFVALHTGVRRLSTAASSIRYSASLNGSAMPAQHTRSTGLLCGRPVALELSTRPLERSGCKQGNFRRIYLHCTAAFSIL